MRILKDGKLQQYKINSRLHLHVILASWSCTKKQMKVIAICITKLLHYNSNSDDNGKKGMRNCEN